MDHDGDDFNSSDLEFEERPNPFFAAGMSSIKAIMDHALEDRIQSKKLSKTLTHAQGSPKTEYMTALWINRFMAFRLHTLKKSAEEVPTGLEIERFLASMISKIKPLGNAVPSQSWIKGGFRRILVGLIFKHPKFTLSPHERSRMKSVFHQFLADGLITRQPRREAQWVGAFLIRRLVVALLRQALEKGTTNWDKTIQKALSMVLIAALSCRGGDIMKTQSETHDRPFLCYDDITIKLVKGVGLESLEAMVVIRNEKGKKFDPRHNRKVLLHVIPGHEGNVVCPIKMILISAMRLGAVQGTIEEILAKTAARRDKTIQWADGRGGNPVLCGFETAAHLVIVDKPAMVDQLRDTIYSASLQAGILKPITPHDMRRGSARDTANVPRDPTAATGLASSVVAAELGHTTISLHKGTTSNYVGASTVDNWTKRVSADLQDPFGPGVTSNVYKKPKITRVQWLKIYEDAGVDHSNRKATRQLRDTTHKEHEQQWRSSEGETPSPRPALLPLSAGQINIGTIIRKRKAEPEVLSESIQIDATNSPAPHLVIEGLDNIDDINSRIDPRLRALAANITRVIGDVDKEEVSSVEIEEMVLGGLDVPLETPSNLLVPGVAYVGLLSRINVIANKRLSSTKSKAIPDTFRGNGKDEPILFQHHCQKTPGCQYLTDNSYTLLTHEARCSAERVEELNTVEKMYKCPVEGCSKSFETATALKMHQDSIHEFQPRACKVEGCDPTILYDSRNAFRKHQKDIHPSWTPKRCPIEGCGCNIQFKTAQALKGHLQVIHQITDKALLKSYTYVRTKSYSSQRCSYPGCGHATEFAEKRTLIKHLERRHSVTKEDASDYITLK